MFLIAYEIGDILAIQYNGVWHSYMGALLDYPLCK